MTGKREIPRLMTSQKYWQALTRSAIPAFFLGISVTDGAIKDITIVPTADTVEVGEPIYLQIEISFDGPLIDPYTNNVYAGMRQQFDVEVMKNGQRRVVLPWVIPRMLYRLDDTGQRFGTAMWISFDCRTDTLAFPDPGEYTVRVVTQRGETASNAVKLRVKPCSRAARNALAILLETPDDLDHAPYYTVLCSTLDAELYKMPRMRKRFQEVSDKYPTTILAEYARARLAIARLRDFTEGRIPRTPEACRDCYKGLRMALTLPNKSPIRIEAAFYLALAEACAGDYDVALKRLDSLTKEHRVGRLSRQAIQLQSELATLSREHEGRAELSGKREHSK